MKARVMKSVVLTTAALVLLLALLQVWMLVNVEPVSAAPPQMDCTGPYPGCTTAYKFTEFYDWTGECCGFWKEYRDHHTYIAYKSDVDGLFCACDYIYRGKECTTRLFYCTW
jgi:hypothetical protein